VLAAGACAAVIRSCQGGGEVNTTICSNPECKKSYSRGEKGFCHSCYGKIHYKENREERLAEAKIYRENNRARIRTSAKNRYHKNKDKLLAYKKTPLGRLPDYKNGAKRRGLEWLLTDGEALELMSLSCCYCGSDGGGIDRVDNSRGYVSGNCVPCCKICNHMKGTLETSRFLDHISKITSFCGVKT
jgi:hypothetical protein